jgi:hypothetical protein
MQGPTDENDPRLLRYTRAWRRWTKQEEKTAEAIHLAEQAAYFAQAAGACRDARARASLARLHLREQYRRLIFRRRELEQITAIVAPVLRNHYNPEENPQP